MKTVEQKAKNAAYMREYRQKNPSHLKEWKQKNREQQLAYRKAWRESNLEKIRLEQKEQYRKNREKRLAAAKVQYQKDPEVGISRAREWRLDNPHTYSEHMRVAKMRRRGRIRAAEGFATTTQIRARVTFYGNKCWICHAPYKAIDHVKPLARGGSNWPANLRPICKSCNSKKRDKWPLP